MRGARRWSGRLGAIAAVSIMAVVVGYVVERVTSTPNFNAEVYELPNARFQALLGQLLVLAVLQFAFTWPRNEVVRTAALTAIAFVVFIVGSVADLNWDPVGGWLVISGIVSIVAAAVAWMSTRSWRRALILTPLFSAGLWVSFGLLSIALRTLL